MTRDNHPENPEANGARKKQHDERRETMSGPVYIDTSAVLKIVFQEPESDALKLLVDQLRSETTLYTSELGLCELNRVARQENVLPEHVLRAVSGFDTLVMDSETYRKADQNHDLRLGVVEALHLAAAAQHGCDTVITYSRTLADAAQAHGIAVLAPSGERS